MKKFFISCDIEGVAGICVWDETMTGTVEYEYFRKQMTREVAAAARVLIAADYEVWIKDAHATARNLLPDLLPENIRLIRNWSGHPYQMMEKLDDSFAGCAMIGYHSAAGKEGNPLAHSFSSRKVYEMRLNGKKFSELEWNNRIARLEGVPLVFVSGDRVIVNEINTIPGFTRISMYPKLWEASGISYRELVNRLLDLAKKRFYRRRQLITAPPE